MKFLYVFRARADAWKCSAAGYCFNWAALLAAAESAFERGVTHSHATVGAPVSRTGAPPPAAPDNSCWPQHPIRALSERATQYCLVAGAAGCSREEYSTPKPGPFTRTVAVAYDCWPWGSQLDDCQAGAHSFSLSLSLSLESRADTRKQRTEPADTRLHSYLTLPEVTSTCLANDSERRSDAAGAFAEGVNSAGDGTGSEERRAVEQVSDHKRDFVTEHHPSPFTRPSNKEKYRRDRYRWRQREHAIEMARRQRHFFDAIQEEFLKDSKSSTY